MRGVVHADERGYTSGMGPGAGGEPVASPIRCAAKSEAVTGVGGTHGGIGGDSCAARLACSTKPQANRETYGSVIAPRSYVPAGSRGCVYCDGLCLPVAMSTHVPRACTCNRQVWVWRWLWHGSGHHDSEVGRCRRWSRVGDRHRHGVACRREPRVRQRPELLPTRAVLLRYAGSTPCDPHRHVSSTNLLVPSHAMQVALAAAAVCSCRRQSSTATAVSRRREATRTTVPRTPAETEEEAEWRYGATVH